MKLFNKSRKRITPFGAMLLTAQSIFAFQKLFHQIDWNWIWIASPVLVIPLIIVSEFLIALIQFIRSNKMI